jgi:esterase/lipase
MSNSIFIDLDSIALNVYTQFFDSRGGTETWDPRPSEGPDGNRVTEDQKWFWDLESKESLSLDYINHSGESHTLFSYYLPAKNEDGQSINDAPTVIIYHGITNCARMMGYLVKMFHDLGFNVLSPDLRGHGRNDEDRMSISILDAKDCVKWIEKLEENSLLKSNIYLYGVSLGGAVAWKAASELMKDEKYAGKVSLIVDATTPDMVLGMSVLFNQNSEWSNLNDENKLTVKGKIDQLLKDKQGYSLYDALNFIEAVACTSPLLLIHGLADSFIPVEIAKNAFEVYQGEPKHSFFVENANHPQAMWHDYDGYHDAVLKFIQTRQNC